MKIFSKKEEESTSDFQKAINLINEYLKKFDPKIEILKVITGTGKLLLASTKLSYKGIHMELGVILPEGGKPDLIITAPLRLPPPGTNLLPVYQQLLRWNFFQTEITHFALDDQGLISLVVRRPLEDLGYSEFEYCISKVSEVTAAGLILLKQNFGI